MGQILPKRGERMITFGGTRAGKSTACDLQLREVVKQPCEVLVVDSKPRFRAEQTPMGHSAERHYKRQAPGPPPIPGSVRLNLDTANPFKVGTRSIFDQGKGRRLAIAQVDSREDLNLDALLAVMDRFFKRADGRLRRIVYIDEMHDFFHPNGYPLDKRDIVRRIWRAGGELGLEGWGSAQRPAGIPQQCKDFSDVMNVFRLNYAKDVKTLREFGWPETEEPPDTPHWFKRWDRGTPDQVLRCQIEVPPRYLAALSKT